MRGAFHPQGPRPHGHPRRGRPPLGWLLARGIHRRVLAFLLLALLLGVGAGAALQASRDAAGWPWTLMGLGAVMLFAVFPLAWVASFRIAWPMRELAMVASELREGRLGRQVDLPQGDGELGQVSQALRDMAGRLSRQLKDQRALMAAVSHELRSPLGRARVLVELAREGRAAGRERAFDELQAEIDAMDTLVGDLLAAARIDFEAVNPQDLNALDLARRALSLAGLPEEEPELEGEPGRLRGDATLLARALSGMLVNARRYGGTSVQLRLEDRGARLRFIVEDDGPGFPEGQVERAFEPFWRGPSGAGTGAPGGEGLGLALVRQIAQTHGGEAGAENRREGGARVWVDLPRG